MNSKKIYSSKAFSLVIVLLSTLVFFFTGSVLHAQGTITPTDCKTGCTSNDVQVTDAYLSDAAGIRLPSTFICPVGGTATVSITLVLSTNTQRKGVSIYSKVNSFTPPSTIGGVVGVISGCNTLTLTGTQNKIVFVNALQWSCGSPIVLTDLFIAWGTGNTNFCNGSIFQCPATPSKCNSLDAGQYLTVQTPIGQSASQTKCETTAGTGTTTFDLRESDATVIGGQSSSTYQVNWYSNAAGTTTITAPASYVSGTDYVYAKVCTINSPIVCSGTQTVTLTVNPLPTASATAATSSQCYQATNTFTLNGSVQNGTASWTVQSKPAGLSIQFGNALAATTTVTVSGAGGGTVYLTLTAISNTTPGCGTAAATVSITVNPLPDVSTIGGSFTKTCVLNPTGETIGETPVGGFSYSWSPSTGLSATNVGNPTANPSSTQTYTVTKTNNATGCTATATVQVNVNTTSASINAGSPFTKTCTENTSGKQIGEAPAAGYSYSWLPTNGLSNANVSSPTGNPSTTTTYTVTKTNNASGCTTTATVTVTVNTAASQMPSIVVSQPTLCGDANGSIQVCSPQAGIAYKLYLGGTASITITAISGQPVIFTGLQAGSNPSVTATGDNGCESAAASCADAIESCSEPNALRMGGNTTDKVHITFPAKEPSVLAYPNPYNDKIRFVVTAPESGQGSLDLFNVLGQKVRNVYQGNIIQGTQTFEVSIPQQHRSTLIYRMILNGRQASGKLINANQ
ncbi:MAG: hypothetical protein ACO1OO_14945 [Flavisolibacter sp.]